MFSSKVGCSTTTKLNFDDFQKLQDQADNTVRHELDEGDLILTLSPTPRHNLVSFNAISPEERAAAFEAWSAGHRPTPDLSDYAVSRDSIYEGRDH